MKCTLPCSRVHSAHIHTLTAYFLSDLTFQQIQLHPTCNKSCFRKLYVTFSKFHFIRCPLSFRVLPPAQEAYFFNNNKITISRLKTLSSLETKVKHCIVVSCNVCSALLLSCPTSAMYSFFMKFYRRWIESFRFSSPAVIKITNPPFWTKIYLVKVPLNVKILQQDLLHRKQFLKIL